MVHKLLNDRSAPPAARADPLTRAPVADHLERLAVMPQKLRQPDRRQVVADE